MVYADYEYYATTYFGQAISEADFPRLALRASAFLDYCTMGRAAQNAELDAVKMACCAVAERYQLMDIAQQAANKSLTIALESDEGEMQGQTVGSWTKSFRSGGDSASAALKAAQNSQSALLDTVCMYLGNTGLLRMRGYMA